MTESLVADPQHLCVRDPIPRDFGRVKQLIAYIKQDVTVIYVRN